MGPALRAACLLSIAVAAASVGVLPVHAQGGAAPPTVVELAYVRQVVPRAVPQTFLDPPPADEGLRGAQLALEDNRTTGRFVGQDWRMHEADAASEDEAVEAARGQLAAGRRLLVADMPAATLLRVAALPEARGALILDATAGDDRLRGADCRVNVVHMLPSHAMLADGLMQFLALKRWRDVLLAVGPDPADQAYAEAMRRAAKKFGLRVVADKPWTLDPGAQRTDTGHVSIAAEAARFTQGITYDVLVVADTLGTFGDDLAFRTALPRPVAGTHGVVPTAWARPFEQWGATQLQSRMLRRAERWMTERDYGAWMAVRAVGEAATRAGAGDPVAVAAYLRGPDFELAAYKGAALTVRPWDGQLRQPVLLAGARSLVSVSPQPGFLHERSELDTLGPDQPETQCRM